MDNYKDMKHNLLLVLALGGLLFASSCQMDEPDSGTLTGEVDFSITAGIPGGITTYSPEDGSVFSHLGGANNVDPATYDLRYTLEIYDNDVIAYKEAKIVKTDFATSSVNFSARLLAKKYTIVLWADFVNEVRDGGAASDLYYKTDDLRSISYTDAATLLALCSDAADAYFKSQEIDLTSSNQKISDIQLNRPLGKIRLIATDVLSNPDVQTERPKSVSIDFKGTTIPTAFNAMTGEVIADNTTTTINVATFNAITEDAQVNGTTHEDAYLLGYAYFFATVPASAHEMDVTIYSDESTASQIGQRSLSNIPVSANKLTTVIGNFYTNEGSIDVIVEDEFGNVENVEDVPVETTASTLAEAESALEKLAADPTTGGKDIVITIPNTPASGDNFDAIEMPALSNNVTIVFEGGISADGLTINDEVLASGSAGNDFTGNLTIKNNATDSQGPLTINLPAGSCTLDGGSYSSISVTTANNTFVVGEDASIETLTVNNGNVIIYGTVAPDKITIDDGASSKIYWGAGTEDRLREVLAYPAEKNHGAILTADIQSTKLDVNNGAQSNQDGFKIAGSNINNSNEFVYQLFYTNFHFFSKTLK